MAQTAARQGGARARSCHAAALNAAALKDQGKGAALTCFVAYTRAREAPTEPHLPPLLASTAVADSFCANSGSGRTLEPPLVRSAAMVTAPVELS